MKNTVILDIDGVVSDYRLGLLWWINLNYPEMRSKCYEHLYRIDTWIDHKSMGVPYREWLDILEKFNLTGGHLLIPEFPGAKMLLNYCKALEYRVVFVTSRPFDIYSNLYKDTIEWLKEKELHYHLLLFSKSKADVVYKLRLLDDVVFAVDDEINHVTQYVELGLKTYWLNHYGVSDKVILNSNLHVVKTLVQITQEESNENPVK